MIKTIDILSPIIEVKDFGRRPTNYKDISALLCLMKLYCEKDFLEIGTWYGKTTYEIVIRNLEKKIYTIDYMEDDLIISEHERKTRAPKEDLCKYAKSLDNVDFIYANSQTYNFDKFKNVDFIFIDGNHSFDGVKIDTQKSIDYLSKNNDGIIAWHDVHTKNLTQVPDYMQYLAKTHDIYYIKNSNIGFIKVS